jgi:hypothetical protein
MPNGNDTDIPVELLERIFGACDALEQRLDQVEAELGPPSPAYLSRKDATPVVRSGSSELLRQTLEEGM